MSLTDDFDESLFSKRKSDVDYDGDGGARRNEDPDYEEDGEEPEMDEEGEEEDLEEEDESFADSYADSSSSVTDATPFMLASTGLVNSNRKTNGATAVNGVGAGNDTVGDGPDIIVVGNEMDVGDPDFPLSTDAERLAYIEYYLEQNAPKERHFKCKLCFDKAFLNCYKLVTHYLSMHKDSDQVLVEGAIAEAKQLEKQLFPPKVPVCETCGKVFKVRKLLTLHVSKFHSKVLCCDLCNKKFYTKPLLYKHMQDEHNIEEPLVDAFDRGRAGRADDKDRTTELMDSSSEIKYYCFVCGKNDFVKLQQLKDHTLAHHGIDAEVLAQRYLIALKELNKEKIERFDNPEEYVACKLCDRKFHHFSINRHVKTVHYGWKAWGTCNIGCRLCGQYFRNNVKLGKHLRGHKNRILSGTSSKSKMIRVDSEGAQLHTQLTDLNVTIDSGYRRKKKYRLKQAAKAEAENGILAIEDAADKEPAASPLKASSKKTKTAPPSSSRRGRPRGSTKRRPNIGDRKNSPSRDYEDTSHPEYDDDKDYSSSPVKIETSFASSPTTFNDDNAPTSTSSSSRRSSRRSTLNPISYNEEVISSYLEESATETDAWRRARGRGGRSGRRGDAPRFFNGDADHFASSNLSEDVKIKSEPVLTLEEFNEQYQRQQALRLPTIFNETSSSQSVFAVDAVGQVVKREDVDLTDSFPHNGNADVTSTSSLAAVSEAIMNGDDLSATVAGRKPFKCNDCDARFSHRRLLSEHLNTFHRLSGTLKPNVVVPGKNAALTNGVEDDEVLFDGVNGNGVDAREAPGLTEFKIEECKPAVLDDDDDPSMIANEGADELSYEDFVDEGEEEGGDDAASNYSEDAPRSAVVRVPKRTPSSRKLSSNGSKRTKKKTSTVDKRAIVSKKVSFMSKKGAKTKKLSKAGRPRKTTSSSNPDFDRDLSGPPAHPCPQCGLWFIASDHLDLHKSFVHDGLKTFMCCYCPDSFGYYHELDKHVKMLHRVDGAAENAPNSSTAGEASESSVGCPYEECKDIRFKTGLHRESHISSVHIGQRYPCPKCLVKAYRSIGGVKKHIEKCQGDSIQMKCSECAEIVAQSALPNHFELNHPGKDSSDSKVVLPPYFPPSFYDRFYGVHRRRVIKTTCDICGENVVGLKKHLMTVCKMARQFQFHRSMQMSFLRTSTDNISPLQVHNFNDYQAREKMESHFEQCHLCDAVLAKRRFKQHLMRKHPRTMPGKTYLCEICARSFHSYTAMYSHKRSIHFQIKVRFGFIVLDFVFSQIFAASRPSICNASQKEHTHFSFS